MIPDETGQRPALVRQPNFPHAPAPARDGGDDPPPRYAALPARRARPRRRRRCARSNDDIIGEDVATLTLRSPRHGVPVLLAGNLAAHGEPPQARDQLRIFGSKATVVLDGYRLSCDRRDHDAARTSIPVATYQGAYDGAIAHFLDGLEQRRAVRDRTGRQPQDPGAGRGGLRTRRGSPMTASCAMIADRRIGGRRERR